MQSNISTFHLMFLHSSQTIINHYKTNMSIIQHLLLKVQSNKWNSKHNLSLNVSDTHQTCASKKGYNILCKFLLGKRCFNHWITIFLYNCFGEKTFSILDSNPKRLRGFPQSFYPLFQGKGLTNQICVTNISMVVWLKPNLFFHLFHFKSVSIKRVSKYFEWNHSYFLIILILV